MTVLPAANESTSTAAVGAMAMAAVDHKGTIDAAATVAESSTHQPESPQDVDAALAAVLAMTQSQSQSQSQSDRLVAAKDHINKALSATLTAKAATGSVSLKQVAQALSSIAAKAHLHHTQATAQLPTLHAQLVAAIAQSPSLAKPIATRLDSLLLTPASTPTQLTCDAQVTSRLSHLTSTRARIESARVALADLRRWSTLASTILATDPSDAAQAFAAARDDLDRLASYLPADEHERRMGVLADLKSQLWSRIAPKLDTALSAASSSSAAGDIAALYALAHKIGADDEFVKQYCTVRTKAIASSSSSPVLTALADTIEHDLATLPLLPPDRLPLSLALLRHALATLKLPDDPTGDPAIISRLDRLYSPTSAPDFTDAIRPLLVRIHGLPHRSSRLALAAIDTLFDRIPLASADPAQIDTVWRSQVMPSALAVASKVIAQHAGVCGGLRVRGKDGLKATVRRTWEHTCARIGKVMARVHELQQTGATAGQGQSASLVVSPEVMARYVAAVSMAAAVLDKAKVVEAQMDELERRGRDGVASVVAEYLASKEAKVEDNALGLVELTSSVGASALNFAFEYVFAPVTSTLTHTVLSPLIKPAAAARTSSAAANQPVRPSTPISRTGTPQPQSSGSTSTPAPRATMVTTLPQFSRSPTPAATALGEYLLQLPHHLHAFSTTTGAVPGAHAFAFADNLQSAVGKLCQSPDAGAEAGADLLEAVVLGAQLTVVHALASRADTPPPPPPASAGCKSSDASAHPGFPPNAPHLTAGGTGSGVSHSTSTGRLASLVSSTLSGLPSSLSMRAGLSEIAASSSSSATSPRLGRSSASAAAAAALAPMDTHARDQLAQDLAYLGNVFTALDCAPRCEWVYILGMVERGAPAGGWDASRVAGVLAEEVGKDSKRNAWRAGKLSELARVAMGDEEVAKWWGKVARVGAGVFPPTAGR